MCLVEGRMMGMELVKFPSASNGRRVHSMVITCVRCMMGKEQYVPVSYYWARSL